MTTSMVLTELISAVVALNLRQGISNSLDTKLEGALQALDDVNGNRIPRAISALQAFIDSVALQRAGQIPEADADALTAAAQKLIAFLAG